MLSDEKLAGLFLEDNPFDRLMRSRMVEALLAAPDQRMTGSELIAAARLDRDPRYLYLFGHLAFVLAGEPPFLTLSPWACHRLGIPLVVHADPLARERALVRRCVNVACTVQEALDYIELGRVSTAG